MSATLEVDAPEDTIPDGGYGWLCVLACFFVNFATWGTVASYGVFLSNYLQSNRYPSASSLDFALVGGFNFAFAMIVAPLVTALTRQYAKHVTMPIGVIIQTAGYISAAFANQVWQLLLSQGVAVGVGIGFIYIPSIPILSQWFNARRSFANGISSAGSGFGGITFAWATGAMIKAYDVQAALWMVGAVTFTLTTIATILIRDRNRYIKPPQLDFDVKLLKRRDVQLLLGWAFITMFGYITLLFSLSDYALAAGFSDQQATDIIGILNIGTAVGRPIIGIASDKSSRINVAGILTFVCGLCCFALWIPATSYGLLVFFALIAGAILGVFWMTIGPLCVEVSSLKDLQSMLSLSWTTIIIPTTFSEIIGLKLRREGSARPYLYSQLFVGFSYLVAAMLMFELRRVKRRQAQSE